MTPTHPFVPSATPVWHARPMDEALHALTVSASTGLNHREATRRLEQ